MRRQSRLHFWKRRHRHASRHRHSHHYYGRHYRKRVFIELTAILSSVFGIFYLLTLSPCENGHPTWLASLYASEEIYAQCRSNFRRRAPFQANKAQELPSALSIIPIQLLTNGPEYQQALTKYARYAPKDNRVTLQYLRSLPPEVKSLCDARCKSMVKDYLKANGGSVDVRDLPLPHK